jgi:hypothetical protein
MPHGTSQRTPHPSLLVLLMARRHALLRALLLACLLALSAALSWPGKGKADAEKPAAAGEKKALKTVKTLSVGVKHRPAVCEQKAADGDRVYVHYRGTLTDGEQFDASCAYAKACCVPRVRTHRTCAHAASVRVRPAAAVAACA